VKSADLRGVTRAVKRVHATLVNLPVGTCVAGIVVGRVKGETAQNVVSGRKLYPARTGSGHWGLARDDAMLSTFQLLRS